MVKFLLGCEKEEVLCQDIEQIMLSNEGKAKLAGPKSLALFEEVQEMLHLDKCERILKFFQGIDG